MREALRFSAALRMANASPKQQSSFVDEVPPPALLSLLRQVVEELRAGSVIKPARSKESSLHVQCVWMLSSWFLVRHVCSRSNALTTCCCFP